MPPPPADIAPANRRWVEPPRTVRGRVGRWVLRLVGQIRRQYLSRLRPGYVRRSIARRRGACRQCGACCNLTFYCPLRTREGLCRWYRHRPRTCRDFPIDALDLWLTRVPCGYYFEAEPEAAERADSAG